MKPTKKDKERAASLVEKWRGLLLLQDWRVTHDYAEPSDEAREEQAAAQCFASAMYRRARIEIFPEFWENPDWSVREYYIAHELCHAVTDELNALVTECRNESIVTKYQQRAACERTTDWVAQIVLRLHKGT